MISRKFLKNVLMSRSRFQSVVFCRSLASRRKPQDPEEIERMPTYEFESVNSRTKPLKRYELYSWGFSASGALGNERWVEVRRDADGQIEIPRKVLKKTPRKMSFVSAETTVYDIAAGSGFTVIAATVKKMPYLVFGCGLNTDSQLGRQDASLDNPLVCVGNVVPIILPLQLDHSNTVVREDSKVREKVVKVAAGRAHTVCLTNFGKIFTLGNNSYGQCGRPIVAQEKYFGSRKVHELSIPDSGMIVDIVCGQDHTLFLDDRGTVFACGWGTDGQLGNGKYESDHCPTKVLGDVHGEKIVGLSSSCDTILAINDKGQVFGWGNSEYGQFSSVTKDTQISVSRSLNFERKVGKVVSVAAGGSMCALVNESGTVFVWGYGILGLGPKTFDCPSPTPLPESLFGKSIFRSDAKVRQVHPGLNHFGAITDRGELYMWGRNNKANLGIGSEIDMNFPYRVPIPSAVRKVSLGPDHTVAMAQKLI